MPPPQVRLFYFERLQHDVMAEMLRATGDFEIDKLAFATSEAENWRVMSAAHAYQAMSARDELPRPYHVTADLLARCPNLLVVSSYGAGYDTVDVEACTAAGVLVVNQAGGNAEAVAQHVLAMMLTLSKRLIDADRATRRGEVGSREVFIGDNLRGKTIGIVGLGNIGARVAELCAGLFGMRALACDPYLTADEIAGRGAEQADLPALLAQSDFVSINCPRTAETAGMIDAAAFAAMKPGARFITTARGGIHDETALARALASGHLAGAGLDVWDVEPPPADHPLLRFDNVIVSPHIAGITRESRHDIAVIAAEQLIAIFRGRRPPRLINPDAWPAYAARFERAFGRPVDG